MTQGKAKKILLGLLLYGCLTNSAQAAPTYTTYEIDEDTKYVTYTDADGNEQKYEYTARTVTGTENTVREEYETPNGDTAARYYIWDEEGTFTDVTEKVLAGEIDPGDVNVTAGYNEEKLSAGIYNDGTGAYEGGDIAADFLDDTRHGSGGDRNYGGAIENRSSDGSSASLGSITGNFISDYETGSNTAEYGGAIANYAYGDNSIAEIGEINGNFIGNYLETTVGSSSSNNSTGAGIANEARGNGTIAHIGSINGNFAGNHVLSNGNAWGGGVMVYAWKEDSIASIGSINGSFIGNTVADTGSGETFGGAVYNRNGYIGSISAMFISNSSIAISGDGKAGALVNYSDNGNEADAHASIIGSIEGDFIGNTAQSTSGAGRGGAILNRGSSGSSTVNGEEVTGAVIGSIRGNFMGNEAVSTSGNAFGGAIENFTQIISGYQGGVSSIGSLEGDFIENAARSTSGNASGGAIANRVNQSGDGTAVIGDITSENGFISNIAESTGGNARGGAIYNYAASGNVSVIGDISADFTGNRAEGGKDAMGGAIYNENGTVSAGGITGNFIENTAAAGTGSAFGGAIANIASVSGMSAETGNINGIFAANSAVSASGSAAGGAIYNTGTMGEIAGDFAGNAVLSESGDAMGGAVYNAGSIAGLGGAFLGNYAEGKEAMGGAVYNAKNGTVGYITADFTGNYAEGADESAGGAVYNSGSIGNITDSTFNGNAALAGGAVYNVTIFNDSIIVTGNGSVPASIDYAGSGYIGEITGSTFTGNTAFGGGAVYNAGIIGSITSSTFKENMVNWFGGAVVNFETIDSITESTFGGNTAGWSGGAIFNVADIGEISGSSFTGNSVERSAVDAAGGAVYNSNSGIIDSIKDTTFTDNYVKSEAGAAYGGAIYNAGSIGVIETGTLSGNYAEGYSDAKGGAIYDESSTGITIDGDAAGNYVRVTGEGDVAGGVIYLAKADEGETSITVTGDVSGNHAETAKGEAKGGAFYNNENGTLTIGGDISGNYALSEDGAAYGGAIYNEGTVNSGGELAVGSLTDNYAQGTNDAKGGAIYDTVSTGVTINGDASGNYVKVTEKGNVAGGVLYLEKAGEGETSVTVTGNVTGNHAETASGSAMGGAFYNNSQGSLSIGGSISGNYALSGDSVAWGGAVYNAGTLTIAEGAGISGNYATGATAAGGAVYNDFTGETGDITADFDGNYVKSETGSAKGGAIYNIGSTGAVSGAFSGNYAASEGSYAQGGAIFNTDIMESIEAASLSGNYAESESSYAEGGAIYNENPDTVITVTGDIADNHVKAATNASGGAILSLGDITVKGDITGNYAEAAGGFAYGGAILNSEGTLTVDAAEISGNHVTSEKGNAKGGVIYNEAEGTTSVTVSGAAKNNYAKGAEAYGGAVYNGNGALAFTAGSLENNHAEGTGTAAGGGIYDKGTGGSITANGDVTGNYAASTGGGAAGGAIFYGDESSGSITITGNVSGNYAESSAEDAGGGAIYTESEDTAIAITGDLKDNYAKAAASALGGAIYSQGTTTVTGAITGNYVEASDDAGGGAIYNEGTLTVNAASIENNHAVSSAGTALAGAIYTDSEDSVITVTGNVTGNYVKAAEEATGGAIHSLGTTTVYGDLTNNYAEGADVQGGAIYAGENSTVNLYGNITGNYASGDTALGGAIYNADGATVNIYVENKDAVISGNYVESGGEKEDNLLYGEAGSVTNFNLTDATLRVDDGITGETGFEVNVVGNGVDATTFYMFNDIKDSNLSFAGTTLNTINNEVHTYSVNRFTVAGDFNMVADVDLASESMDRFVTSGNSYGEAKGSLNVSGMNLISDTEKDRVGVYFAEPGLKENVTSSVGQLPGSEQQTAYTPLYKYNVSYDKNYDGSWGEDGGYFVFDREGNNPAAMIPPVAQLGAFNAMSMLFDYCFEHSDYYMKLPSEVRLAIREKAKAAKAEKLAEANGTTAEEEVKGIEAARQAELEAREGIAFYDHDNVLPLYDQHELTRPGAWVKPFASTDTTPFKGHFTARDKYYGMLLGVDTDVREGKNGWASVFTGYAGYQGIHQSFSGGTIRQDGGILGVTETFYKKNFYTAWTAAASSTRADGRTMYGHEKSRLYTMGIASKSGWNLEYDGGKYAVLPTFMASYTNVDMRSYTNAAGLRMDADDLRAVQLKPNVKWIMNLENGWQPYLTAGEVWTVSQRGRVRADGNTLDQLCLHPYTEYGIGVQKRWANDYDGYAQILGHAGGMRGALITLGFRWTFN